MTMPLTSFDFQQARVKQVVFKSQLRSVLYGVRTVDNALFSFADNPLGQWLQVKMSSASGTHPSVRELHRTVRQLLRVGQHLAARYQRGQTEEARAGLVQIDALTDQIEGLLLILENSLLLP